MTKKPLVITIDFGEFKYIGDKYKGYWFNDDGMTANPPSLEIIRRNIPISYSITESLPPLTEQEYNHYNNLP